MRRRLLPLIAALALAGCAAGPDYRRPELPAARRFTEDELPPLPDAGHEDVSQHWLTGTDVSARWWQLFRSPALDRLVEDGLRNNPGVTAADAALRSARESVAAQQAAYFPAAAISYAGSRQKIAAALASPASSNARFYNLHTAQLSISYTPDVFGANRRQVESLQAQADNLRWAAEATWLTLTSNIVAAAIQEAALRAQVQATRKQIELQADVVARYRTLQRLGQAAELDVSGQVASLAAVEAALPPLDKALAQQRDLIKALVGRLPDQTLAGEFTLAGLQLPEQLPLTLPSSLVEHRPDILAAEAQLRQASAAIGIARAARLPSVELGVDGWGSTAYTLGKLFSPGTGFWTLGASVSQTVFDAGMLSHREAAARAAYEEAAAQYKSTVIGAFQNVADALQALQADAGAVATATHAEEAARRSLEIARRQLALGDISTLALLQAEQASWQAAIGVAQARAARLADTAALFQALGGGWWNRT